MFDYRGNILVTGGAGYIGSHICHALHEAGYTPVVLDNLCRGHGSMVKFGPLIEGDIGDTDLITQICAQYKPLAAMHFAALIEVAESVKSPHLFMDNNWKRACTLMDALRGNGVNKVVFSSTAAVYGIPEHPGAIAEDWPLKPVNPYGESKLLAEGYLRQQEQMRSVVLRYFNAAGALPKNGLGEAHWPESHLIPNALLTLLSMKSGKFTLFGEDYPTPDGTAVRDYIHVADLAEAHMAALEYLLKDGTSAIINLGTGIGYSVKEVLDMVKKVTGTSVKVTHGARRAGDPPYLVADNTRAAKMLNWRPRLELEVIVTTAFAWHATPLYRRLIGR
jgi:UDP-glucose 4-epimerase